MGSIDRDPVTDEDARRLAKNLTSLFSSPLKVFGKEGFSKPVTIADAIRFGGILIAGINSATGDPALKERTADFTAKIAELAYRPEELELFLYSRIKERTDNPAEIEQAVAQTDALVSGPGAMRRFVFKAIREVLPKGRTGRPSDFDFAHSPEQFLEASSQIQGACHQFLSLHEQFPKKTIKGLCEFLQDTDAQGVNLMRKHEDFISQTLNDYDFQILKSAETRSRRLADAITGKELFGWSYKYAVQRGGEFRRAKEANSEEEK